MKVYQGICSFIVLSLLLLTACKKYVDIQPKGKIVPTTLNDFQLLLNNSNVFNMAGGSTDFMTDDVAFTDTSMFSSLQPYSILNTYEWANNIYNANDNDPDWNGYYQQIYYANIVINGAPGATEGTDTAIATLIAKAKVHRAFSYLGLVNQYATQYDSATAAQDPGVPLLLAPTYTQKLNRATVKAVYDQILSDLGSSVSALPGLPAFNTDPSRTAAYALLARTYLYMGNYPAALLYADSTLQLQNTLLDLRPYGNASSPFVYLGMPLSNQNPEVILMKAADNEDAPILLSPELLNLFSPDDIRFQAFAIGGELLENYNGYFFSYISPLESRHEGPRVGEVYMIKAECQVRTGDIQGGLQTANLLRQMRFSTSTYTPLTATGQQDALAQVLQERRRELMGRGFRLTDLKRLNKDPALAKTVIHPLATGSISQPPNSNLFIFPIAPNVLAANPEIGQSPR